jgi:hypothetical protein
MNRDERETKLYECVAEIEGRAQSAACPIYGINKGQGTVLGSAFLLNVGGYTLLITAAHVLYLKHEYVLCLPGEGVLVPFDGEAYTTCVYNRNGRPNFRQDIAFVVLKPDSAAAIRGCRVLEPADLDVNHSPLPQTLYSFTGFPETKNRPKLGRRFLPTNVVYTAVPASSLLYTQLRYNQSSHFAVEFKRSHVFSHRLQVTTGPKPHGMSGGPVWRLGPLAPNRIEELQGESRCFSNRVV